MPHSGQNYAPAASLPAMADPIPYTESLAESLHVFRRFPLQDVRGIPLMEPIAQQWGLIESFQARPDDLLIATYPKAGTTWMQEIVDLILARGDTAKAHRAPTHIRIPFLEICSPPPVPSGVTQLLNAPSPRVIKTHLPFQLVPKTFWEQGCKVIYVARNAKDNVVSYYFFDRMNQTQPEPGPWPEYLQKFMDEKLAWGSWYDHVRRYWEERHNHRILYVFYEDMKEDLEREITRVAAFLEQPLTAEQMAVVVHHSSFEVMRDNPMANYSSIPTAILDQSISPFMRRGEVGDWRNHFTVAQSEAFDTHYRHRMGDAEPHFRTRL
ncbi:sulfotransferase 1B1 isoform X1 [Apteryx mantelli]|uniref:Sulfotransferase n=2 Tax=Apteryx mantelli TaxID=2696672 RepID=A0ABM4G1H2_9AVES